MDMDVSRIFTEYKDTTRLELNNADDKLRAQCDADGGTYDVMGFVLRDILNFVISHTQCGKISSEKFKKDFRIKLVRAFYLKE